MAIDLCNKLGPLHVADGHAVWDGRETRLSVPLDILSPPEREVIELAYGSAMTHPTPATHVVGDPAAWESRFSHVLDRVAVRLDPRSSRALRDLALNHPDPAMRERALYEYADRNEPDAIELLSLAVTDDPDRQVRWDALWAIEKLGGIPAIQALRRFERDEDPEIAEWASLFISELQTGEPAFDARPGRSTPGRTFDETIFLLIHCDLYVRLNPNNQVWGKLSLAPQALARVYGQAHACPNAETRERQLVIAKTIAGLHPDGTPHVDNYLFRGFTDRTREDRGHFFFESRVPRPFFVSGRADDHSKGVREATVEFMREGCWYLDNRIKIREEASAIRYVRGSFQGWGYVDLERIAGRPLEEVIVPGNAILSTLHDPVVGPMTNTFIAGTFKGKLNDWDGDGAVDLNSRKVYSTTNGELDSDMDGRPDAPGVSCCMRNDSFPV
jgi:hypothetical protein